MTELSRRILSDFQVRKTKKQKSAFIELLKNHYPDMRVEEGGFPRCRNLILGDVDSAKVICAAHYDTCARLPFPNMIAPKNLLFTLFYSLMISLPFFAVMFAAIVLFSLFLEGEIVKWLAIAVYFISLFGVMIFGPANKHTANDNTSGVITVLELMENAPEGAAFVLFDHEETGLIGSAFFRKKHKSAAKNALLINFDCVSDGDHMLLVLTRPVRKEHLPLVEKCFADAEGKTAHIEKSSRTYYPSDQQGFRRSIAAAALKKRRLIGLYMNRIHTDKDTVFDESNIDYFVRGTRRLMEELT